MKSSISIFFVLILISQINGQQGSDFYSVYYPSNKEVFSYIEPSEVGVDTSTLKKISSVLRSWVKAGDLMNGELLILKGERTIFHENYGWLNREKNKPVRAKTIWYIRSLSKPITATAVMLLIEDGKLSLEDRVQQYFPNFAGDSRTTIADLLAHRAGYSVTDGRNIKIQDFENIIGFAEKCASIRPTEEYGSYGYDNNGYGILGGIVEKAVDITLEKYIEENIFRRLGMNDSYCNYINDPEFRDRVSNLYDTHPFSQEYYVRRTQMRPPLTYYFGYAGILSTVTDYAKLFTAFKSEGECNNKRLLSQKSVDSMLTIHGFADRRPFEIGFGYGWWVNVDHDAPTTTLNFGHEGGDESLAYFYPKEDLTVIFFSNSKGKNVVKYVRKLLGEVELVKDSKSNLTISAKESKHTFQSLNEQESLAYAGYYIGPKGGRPSRPIVNITFEDGRLKSNMMELGHKIREQIDLFYLGEDRFKDGRYFDGKPYWISSDMIFTFRRENQKVVSLDFVIDQKTVMTLNAISEDSIELLKNEIKKYRLIDNIVRELISDHDSAKVKDLVLKIYDEKPDHILLTEARLNSLGYRYLEENRIQDAITVLEINAQAYPNSYNCFDSLADAWKQYGNYFKAREFYKKAFDLATRQSDSSASVIEKKLVEINTLILNK